MNHEPRFPITAQRYFRTNLNQNEAQSARSEPTHKGTFFFLRFWDWLKATMAQRECILGLLSGNNNISRWNHLGDDQWQQWPQQSPPQGWTMATMTTAEPTSGLNSGNNDHSRAHLRIEQWQQWPQQSPLQDWTVATAEPTFGLNNGNNDHSRAHLRIEQWQQQSPP